MRSTIPLFAAALRLGAGRRAEPFRCPPFRSVELRGGGEVIDRAGAGAARHA